MVKDLNMGQKKAVCFTSVVVFVLDPLMFDVVFLYLNYVFYVDPNLKP